VTEAPEPPPMLLPPAAARRRDSEQAWSNSDTTSATVSVSFTYQLSGPPYESPAMSSRGRCAR
jgi:hypothetical protein